VTAIVYSVGVAVYAVVVLLVRPAAFSSSDLAWSVACGVAGTIGVLALYAALAAGRMGIVAPVTAALAGAGPAAFDLVSGSHVGAAPLVGLVLAIAAVVIVSTVTDPEDEHATPPRAVVLSVISGTGFALALISLSFTGHESGLAPLLVARCTGALILGVALLGRGGGLGLDGSALRPALLAGVFDTAANFTMLTALRIGPMAVASVIGSLYPVTTILLARTVLHERLHRMQIVGVGLALAAVVLTALP
jgi:drug/metabolite transporter (DMT)-like permease